MRLQAGSSVFTYGPAAAVLLTTMLPSTFKFDTLVVLGPRRPPHSNASDRMRTHFAVVELVEQTSSRTDLQPAINRRGFYLRRYAQKRTMGEILDLMGQQGSLCLLPNQANAGLCANLSGPEAFAVLFRYRYCCAAQQRVEAAAAADVLVDETLKRSIEPAGAASKSLDDPAAFGLGLGVVSYLTEKAL